MATTTNYSWSTPDDTALVKDGAAAIRSLGTAIDTTVFNNAGAAINKSLVDAAGDLLIGTADNTVGKLAIGTASQQLRVNSGATSLEYFSPAAAGGMTLISETVASANSSISFSSLGSYKQLLLVYSGIRHSITGSTFAIRLNNSSAANRYQGHSTKTNTTTLTSQGFDGTSILFSGDSNDVSPFGINAIATLYGIATDVCGSFLLDNYTSTTKNKSFNGTVGYYNDTGAFHSSAFYDGAYMDTAAITSIDIVRLTGSATITNSSNTTIRLYGVA
jgi:hypothetical protein